MLLEIKLISIIFQIARLLTFQNSSLIIDPFCSLFARSFPCLELVHFIFLLGGLNILIWGILWVIIGSLGGICLTL